MIDFLVSIIDWLNDNFFAYYAISLVVFSVLFRLLVLPLDVKSRKGMRKMTKIQPMLTEIQKKYANDQVKLQKKQQELMQKEHYNPLSGCLPMLLQYPILLIMFYAMRSVANREMARQVLEAISGVENPIRPADTLLWIRNIWAPDSFFSTIAPDLNQLRMIPKESWMKAVELLSQEDLARVLTALNVTELDFANNLTALLTPINSAYSASVFYRTMGANCLLTQTWIGNLYWPCNGYMILAVLSLATQLIMTKVNPTGQEVQANDSNANQQGQGMTKFMKYFFPIFSFYCCVSSYAAFALYWVTSNVLMIGMTFGINKYLDMKEAREDANKNPLKVEGTIR